MAEVNLKDLDVKEIKAYLFDLGVQIENLNQQRQVLLNELVSRNNASTGSTEVKEQKEKPKKEAK